MGASFIRKSLAIFQSSAFLITITGSTFRASLAVSDTTNLACSANLTSSLGFCPPPSTAQASSPAPPAPSGTPSGPPSVPSNSALGSSVSAPRVRRAGRDWEAMQDRSRGRPFLLDLPKDVAKKLPPGSPLPTLFLSHGSPMSSVQDSPPAAFWRQLGEQVCQLPGIQSVLIVSAHWETQGSLRVNTASLPPTVHDFYGFPPELYTLHYPVQGSKSLSARVLELLKSASIPVSPDPRHGLDHGAWVPLRWMLPEAPLPVVQLSLLLGASGEEHLRVGEALRPLREEGVLIVGSGSSVHNLDDLGRYMGTERIPPYTDPFEKALEDIMCTKDVKTRSQSLIDLESNPLFEQAHPTPEHFYPMNVVVGAAGEDSGRKLFEMAEATIGYSAFSFGAGL